MIELTWWWALLLLPLPFLVTVLSPGSNRVESALAVPLLIRASVMVAELGSSTGRLARYSLWLFWICVVMAASQPYWLGEPTHRRVSGRDLMLAIDISGSMQETDMMIGAKFASRIDVLKEVVNEFISRRTGDRLGLILFGTRAYTYVPLTFDRTALMELLVGVSSGLAGRFTAIGDAIGLSIKTLGNQESRHKVLILVTDGDNTGGTSDPLIAARIAGHEGMTIYTIGVGNDDTTLRRLVNERNISAGTVLNEKALRQIAAVTGGQYFRATDTASLERIYQTLDELEPVELSERLHRPRIDLFQWPLLFGMCVVFVFFCYAIFDSIRLRQK